MPSTRCRENRIQISWIKKIPSAACLNLTLVGLKFWQVKRAQVSTKRLRLPLPVTEPTFQAFTMRPAPYWIKCHLNNRHLQRNNNSRHLYPRHQILTLKTFPHARITPHHHHCLSCQNVQKLSQRSCISNWSQEFYTFCFDRCRAKNARKASGFLPIHYLHSYWID